MINIKYLMFIINAVISYMLTFVNKLLTFIDNFFMFYKFLSFLSICVIFNMDKPEN